MANEEKQETKGESLMGSSGSKSEAGKTIVPPMPGITVKAPGSAGTGTPVGAAGQVGVRPQGGGVPRPGSPGIGMMRSKLPSVEWRGERVESIIPPAFKGLMVAGGFFGAGKTSITCGVDDPGNVLFVDFEDKGEGITVQLGIENYFSPTREMAGLKGLDFTPWDVYQRARQLLEEMPHGRFTVVVLDGITTLQQAMFEEVTENPTRYAVRVSKDDKVGLGGMWPGVSTAFNQFLGVCYAKGVQVVATTAAAEASWTSTGPIPGKFEVKGVKAMHQKSILTLLMIPGLPRNLGAPSALVLKEQLGEYSWDAVLKKMIARKRLPPKLPLATMDEVYRYMKEPANWAALKVEEVPEPEEIEPFKKTVAKDQLMAYMELMKLARVGGLGNEEGEE